MQGLLFRSVECGWCICDCSLYSTASWEVNVRRHSLCCRGSRRHRSCNVISWRIRRHQGCMHIAYRLFSSANSAFPHYCQHTANTHEAGQLRTCLHVKLLVALLPTHAICGCHGRETMGSHNADCLGCKAGTAVRTPSRSADPLGTPSSGRRIDSSRACINDVQGMSWEPFNNPVLNASCALRREQRNGPAWCPASFTMGLTAFSLGDGAVAVRA
jgi:hypothetical protein